MMNDQMCGPSNALKRIQNHTGADHSLQRDRITQPGFVPEEFRTTGSSNAHHEINAFQAGELPDFHIDPNVHPQHHMQFAGHQVPLHQAPRIHSPALHQGNSWAADFHHNQLHHAHAHTLSHPKQAASSNWHSEFAHSTAATRTHQQSTPFAHAHHAPLPMRYMHFQAQPAPSAVAQAAQFDDEAFERAFAEASAELETVRISSQVHETEEDEVATNAFEGELLDPAIDLEDVDVASTLRRRGAFEDPDVEFTPAQLSEIESTRRKADTPMPPFRELRNDEETEKPKVDHDELSRTAGALLETVSTDTSAKFKKSNFFELMRKLRDQEVKVEGENIVNSAGSSSGAADAVGGAPAPAREQDFYPV